MLYTCMYSHYWIFILISNTGEQDEAVCTVCIFASTACDCMHMHTVWLAVYACECILYVCVYGCVYWEYMLLVEPRGMQLWQPCLLVSDLATP